MGGSALKVLGTAGNFLGPAGQIVSAITSVAGAMKKPEKVAAPAPQAPAAPAEAPKFTPTRPDAMARPSSFSELASFSPEQERSAIATKGVQTGLDQAENDYYRNLVQRSLIGDGNKPAADTSSLLPVEGQYFSGQGVNTSDIMEFLRQLRGTA